MKNSFFFSSRRRHTRFKCDWSSDVCSSDLIFSIRPRGRDVLSSFFEPGTAQRAAGFFVYGPQTCLVLAIDHRRSEERRVGKESRAGECPWYEKDVSAGSHAHG